MAPGTRPPPNESVRPAALVVEPDRLTRWSIRTYLEAWFDVRTAATAAEACALARAIPASRLSVAIVAERMPDGTADVVIQTVRECNPQAGIIETVVCPSLTDECARTPPPDVKVLEKPFLLDTLGDMLRSVDPSGHRPDMRA